MNSSKVIGNSPEVLNSNRLFLKLNRFICNYLPVLPDHSLEGKYVAVSLVRISWSPTSTDSIETNQQTLCCISESTMKYQQQSVWKPDRS